MISAVFIASAGNIVVQFNDVVSLQFSDVAYYLINY